MLARLADVQAEMVKRVQLERERDDAAAASVGASWRAPVDDLTLETFVLLPGRRGAARRASCRPS